MPQASAAGAGVADQPDLTPVRLAQSVAQVPLGPIPTDVTPVDMGREISDIANPGWRFRMMQRLPPRLWFNMSTEVSQRLDTNVLFTARNPEADYTFRVLPNVSLGYNVLKNTSVYCNYFVIKDVFARNGSQLTFPTTQSLSLGLRQDITINPRTFAQIDFQARELWQTTNLNQADLLPAINLTRLVGRNGAVFGSVVLQMRSAKYFQGPTREIDPFYSLGLLYRRGAWTFIATNTFVNNFRRKTAIPNISNLSMISDFEVSRPIYKKFPALVAFVRAEPIWNFDSHRAPGLSGFDFRLFGGMRFTVTKPSYAAQVSKLKEQLLESEPGPARPKSQTPSSSQKPISLGPGKSSARQAPARAHDGEDRPMRIFISQPVANSAGGDVITRLSDVQNIN